MRKDPGTLYGELGGRRPEVTTEGDSHLPPGRLLADQRAFCCCFIFLCSGFLLRKEAAEPRQTETSEAAACLLARLSELEDRPWCWRG